MHYSYVAIILFNTCLCRSVRKGVLSNFPKPTGKHPRLSLFLNKVAGFRSETLLKMRLRYRRFPVNPAKLPRTPSSQNTFGLRFLSFGKLVIHLSALPVFFVLNQTFWIKTLKYVSSCYVILLCNFVLTLQKPTLQKLFMKLLLCENILPF